MAGAVNRSGLCKGARTSVRESLRYPRNTRNKFRAPKLPCSEGTTENIPDFSAVPSGLGMVWTITPSVKTLGYFHYSLREIGSTA